MKKISATILGGTGYGAGELLRYLSYHPEAEVTQVVSSSNPGAKVGDFHPHLSGFYEDVVFSSAIDLSLAKRFERSVIFSSLPHGTSSEELFKLYETGLLENVHLIDLSGDLRIQDELEHKLFYSDVPFRREFRELFLYSIPELGFKVGKSHISNPGCLATAGALAAAPLKQLNLESAIIIDAKTGTSGAGKSPQAHIHHPRRHGNFEAYKVLSHRHEPEIRFAAGLGSAETMFVPHLLPVSRGIFTTVYATLMNEISKEEAETHFQKFYGNSPFVRIKKSSPSLHEINGTNFCDIAVEVRGRQIVVMVALDNLGKGMAGQAIQNMNLVCELPQDAGLRIPALGVQ